MGSTHRMIPLRNHDACFAVNESYAEIQRIQRDNTGRFDQALGYRGAHVNSRSYPNSWPDLEATTRNVPCESTAEVRL